MQHFVKQAMLDLAADLKVDAGDPHTREPWATLAKTLGVKVIHVAERDTQVPVTPKRMGEFVNTWSVEGFVSEGAQPAELGWGSHERKFPARRAQARFRRRLRDLPDATGRGDSRAHLDAEGRLFPRLPDHARRGDVDRRLP